MATIETFLAQTQLPAPALKPITDKLEEYLALVAINNKRVAQVNASKDANPNNTEYLDSLWKAEQAANNEKVAELAANFDAVAEQYEKLLAQLREIAKNEFIEEALSEDAVKATRKLVNEGADAIATSKQAVISMLEIPKSILGVMQVEMPEGGLESLLPVADSLKNLRGRKATGATGEKIYVTRVGEILLDGVSTNIDGKGKFAYAADALSKKFGADSIPENAVSVEELEPAYWEACGKEFRSVKSTELPVETTFVFEKSVLKQNPNDEGKTAAPVKVSITVRNPNYGQETKTEAPKAETKPANAESANVEASAEKAPAKKATSAPKK